jgi:hypothetical protein
MSGNRRVSAQIQEHAVALQGAHAAIVQANLNGLRSNETALPKHQFGAADLVFVHVHADKAVHHPAFASPHFSHFNRRRRSATTEIAVMTDEIGDFSAMNDVFCRQAGDVGA